ncbi:hypothetical protein G647_08543 [Cladophialophora carrionii CBS 160.54]|uniref:Uncharacterized protein n=1 Tax=Cladophialophora carrionii CBS 160.54 TaxID=1279043 RepID=V9D1K6_9EURO|nr:uncharacterized protein G647_08543 [Cladophialophora carrionii CBS 160.54]ETI20506.1 hypothetical protein G647_08543 [Cladophialophora carrionii CBS 160.54]
MVYLVAGSDTVPSSTSCQRAARVLVLGHGLSAQGVSLLSWRILSHDAVCAETAEGVTPNAAPCLTCPTSLVSPLRLWGSTTALPSSGITEALGGALSHKVIDRA